MSADVVRIFPADDFKTVAANSAEEIVVGITIGYDENGYLCVYGGGLLDGKQPTAENWLWMVESFKRDLINGEYAEQ